MITLGVLKFQYNTRPFIPLHNSRITLEMNFILIQIENPMAQPVEYLKIDPKTQHMLDHTTTEFGDDKFWPLSGKPCFHVFLVKSQLKPLYHLVLPVKIQSMLPCSTVPVVLTYCGKKWEMIYYGEKSAKRFNWKEFAIDNGLKVGDACVFELMEISKTNLKFRVQILRG
ncbi:unnamed protein product [Camellia sinensis]